MRQLRAVQFVGAFWNGLFAWRAHARFAVWFASVCFAVFPQVVEAAKTPQTITGFTPSSPRSFQLSLNFGLSATGGGSGNPIVYSSSTKTVCTVSGNVATVLKVGTCILTANQAGSSTYAAAPTVTASVVVNKGNQTIGFSSLADKFVGDGAFLLSATSTSGLSVSFASTTTSTCTVSGTAVTLGVAGPCTIAADQAGDTNFNSAPQVTQMFNVNKRPQSITFNALSPRTMLSPSFPIWATSSAGLSVVFSSQSPSVCTVSGSVVSLAGLGTCVIAADQAGNSVYAAAPQVTQSFPVTKVGQIITFDALPTRTVQAPPFTLTASASSTLSVVYSSQTTAVCTVVGSTVTLAAVGTCTIAANQPGNSTYAPAPQVTQSFLVSQASQAITFGALAAKLITESPVSVAATASSGLPVAFNSQTSTVCTVTGSSVTLTSAGLCTIAADQAGDAKFAAAPEVAQSFAISKLGQTITFAPLSAKAYGAPPFAVSATATSGLPVSFSSAATSVCSVSGGQVAMNTVGTCVVAASQPGNTTYAPAPQVQQSFTVTGQVIDFPGLAPQRLGALPFTVSASASSGLPVIFASTTQPICTVSGSTVTLVAAGNCTITADQPGDTMRPPAPQVQQSFEVLGGIAYTFQYDQLNRLVSLSEAAGANASYSYDAVGNLLSVSRSSIAQTSIAGFTPSAGPAGTVVTINGAGFGSAPSDVVVLFAGAQASPSSVSSTQISVNVPNGATTGPISVSSQGNTVTSAQSFIVGATLAPTITSISPSIAAIGATVNITGMGFQPTMSSDKVGFNGRLAQTTGATATTLSATVPSGASSGKVSVATPYGSAQTSTDFFAVPPPYTPNDIAIKERINIGDTRSYTFASKQGALLVFDAVSGARINMTITNLSVWGMSVTLYGPNGLIIYSRSFGGSSGYIDVLTLPATGTYTIFWQYSIIGSGGDLTFTLGSVSQDYTSTIQSNGTPTQVSISSPGQNAILTFAGIAGQRVSLDVPGPNPSRTITILNPDGSTLASSDGYWGQYFDALLLRTTGTYKIIVDPASVGTGTVGMTLYNVPPDVTMPIATNGMQVTVTTTVPGQNASLPFDGTAGKRISLNVPGHSPDRTITIYKPDGTVLAWADDYWGQFFDPLTLPASGTYRIGVDLAGSGTGSVPLTLYDVPPDINLPIAADGNPVTVSISTPGQNAYLTFAGTAGQRVSLNNPGHYPEHVITIYKPDGTQLASRNDYYGNYFDALTLPVTGTYKIGVDLLGAGIGNTSLTLYDVPPDIAASVDVNGGTVSLATTAPGQNGAVTFPGVASQQITVHLTANSAGCPTVTLLSPTNAALASANSCSASFNLASQTLPATGTYTVRVDPDGISVGGVMVSVTSP